MSMYTVRIGCKKEDRCTRKFTGGEEGEENRIYTGDNAQTLGCAHVDGMGYRIFFEVREQRVS